jgi:hypothetical protein
LSGIIARGRAAVLGLFDAITQFGIAAKRHSMTAAVSRSKGYITARDPCPCRIRPSPLLWVATCLRHQMSCCFDTASNIPHRSSHYTIDQKF